MRPFNNHAQSGNPPLRNDKMFGKFSDAGRPVQAALGGAIEESILSQTMESEESRVSGQGSDLVLLHGLGGTWHIWKPLIPLLEKKHRVHAVTLPGHLHGPALPPGTPASRQSLVETLMADLRRRGIENPHLVGNSLGGLMALELARRGYARSVTAISPAGAWAKEEDFKAVSRTFRIVFAILPILIVLLALLLRFAGVRKALNKKAMEHGDRMPEGECRAAMHSMRQTRILPELLRTMRRDGPIAPIKTNGVPICIAWCEHDNVIPFEAFGRPMLELVQGSEHVTIRGVGHVPMYDDPQQLADIILQNVGKAEQGNS